MFIYSNSRMIHQNPIGFDGMKIDGKNHTFVKSYVWETENNYFGFRFPTLYITAFLDEKESLENRDDYCECGINEISAEHAIVYRFSPRDMLATLDYLEYTIPEELPKEDEDKERFCEHFTNQALIETHADRPIEGKMYFAVLGFFTEVFSRYEKSENNE